MFLLVCIHLKLGIIVFSLPTVHTVHQHWCRSSDMLDFHVSTVAQNGQPNPVGSPARLGGAEYYIQLVAIVLNLMEYK